MDITLPLSLIAFLALIASWIILPNGQTERAAAPSAAASASKA
jgi:hypothetical protein